METKLPSISRYKFYREHSNMKEKKAFIKKISIYLKLFFIFNLLSIMFLSAQSAQIFQPLQKPVTYKFISPVTQVFTPMPVADSTNISKPQNTLPLNFYSTHLGVACKMELKLEKQIKLPLRIRLGSKDQVDYLEGKYNQHR
jgi:hypothetical protein